MNISKQAFAAVVGIAMLGASSPSTAAGKKAQAKPKQLPFSFRLYDELVQSNPNANLIVSPYSISEAIAMTRLGARGTTARQIDVALTGKDQPIDNNARLALREQLTGSNTAQFGTEVKIANSLWLAKRYPINDAFRNDAEKYFGATSTGVNFADTAATAKQINDWISTATNKEIENLVGPQTLNATTRAFIVNALYFHSGWAAPFAKSQTAAAPFTANGKRIQVPTMTRQLSVKVTPVGTEVDLYYLGPFIMRLLLPKKSGAAALRSGALELAANNSTRITCSDVSVSIPKWESTSTIEDLKPALEALGIADLFDTAKSDLGGITAAEQLSVDTVAHQATITVDEEGTTAAAVTAIAASPVSAPPPNDKKCPSSVAVNRSFTYVIQHIGANEVLFAGQIVDPTQA